MESFSNDAATKYPLHPNNDWLRRRQWLALPVIPPSHSDARKYFFRTTRELVAEATANGKSKIDYTAFAQTWNRSADGKSRCYVTPELLANYTKNWERTNNIRATQELIRPQLNVVQQTTKTFAAMNQPFPTFLVGTAASSLPQHGVVDIMSMDPGDIPASLSVSLAISQPPILPPNNPRPVTTAGIALELPQQIMQSTIAPPSQAGLKLVSNMSQTQTQTVANIDQIENLK